jgi:hypothetical protein
MTVDGLKHNHQKQAKRTTGRDVGRRGPQNDACGRDEGSLSLLLPRPRGPDGDRVA